MQQTDKLREEQTNKPQNRQNFQQTDKLRNSRTDKTSNRPNSQPLNKPNNSVIYTLSLHHIPAKLHIHYHYITFQPNCTTVLGILIDYSIIQETLIYMLECVIKIISNTLHIFQILYI